MKLVNFDNEAQNYCLMFGAVVFFTVLLRIIFSTGFYVTADDYYYSKAAYEISQGYFSLPDNHWNARIGHTISIAISYWLFGVGEYTATFAAIFFSILNIVVIFLLCKELFPRDNYKNIALLASIFFTFLPISIAEGSSLSMHQGAAFFMFFSLYFMFVGERSRKLAFYVLSGLTVGISYLFHETGAYIFIPIALFYLIKKKFEWRALLIFVFFVLVMGLEAVSYYQLTDKWLYRQTISTNPLEALNKSRVSEDMDFVTKLESLKTIDNPLNGTFFGDSWVFEPFRWSFLDPSNSIFYHIMVVLSVMLLFRKDRKIVLLLGLCSGLYLYFAYGSPNPFSYEPLRRLPRYTLPTAILGSIIIGYGLNKITNRPVLIASVIVLYVSVSILSISVKGGEIGQKLYQAKHFYKFMSAHPDKHYLTDLGTYEAIEFIGQYENKFEIKGMKSKAFISRLNNTDLDMSEIIIFINVPESYPERLAVLDAERFSLVQRYDRKSRKICYINFIQEKLSDSLCDISKGGRIYQVLPAG